MGIVRALALDPGERVGWARADIHPDGSWENVHHGITPLRDMALKIHDAITDYDLVIMEKWVLYPHMAHQFHGSSFPSVQFVGMVKLCCWVNNIKLVMQGAAIKKIADKTMSEELRKKVTRAGAHDDLHDMDALRHLWFYTWKEIITKEAQRAA
jgi:hypothetical protein